jgi:hypothetical protein
VNEWTFNGVTFSSDDAKAKIEEGFIGFIYLISDKSNGKMYVGKKLLVGKRRLPPLKGKTRKRVKIVESDWKTYHGSSELLQEEAKKRPCDFFREILFFAKSKGELSYLEAKEQFDREVLLRDEYYNNFIGCKIHGAHVASLRKK